MQDDNRENKTKIEMINAFSTKEERAIRLKNIRKWIRMNEEDIIRDKLLDTFPKVKIQNLSQDEIAHFEKFRAEFYQNQRQIETTNNLIQRFSSIGYSIINKTKSFQEDFTLDMFQSSIELSINDLQQLLRFVKKIRLNSEFGKLASILKKVKSKNVRKSN